MLRATLQRLGRPGLTLARAMALSGLVAAFCALWSVASIGLLPPKLTPRQSHVAAAATSVMFDTQDSIITGPEFRYREFTGYVGRATLYGQLITSAPLLDLIGRRIGVPGDEIYATTRLTGTVPSVMREPAAEQRSYMLSHRDARYRLDVQPDPALPVVTIYAQAPTVAQAVALADGAVDGLQEYLAGRERLRGHTGDEQFLVQKLGPARGAIVNGQIPVQMVVLTFLIAFAITLMSLLSARHVRRSWVAAGAAPGDGTAPGARGLTRARETARSAGGDWPHTTRVLPWMLAGFLIILWLVPFNVIQLNASLPFDLKFDRLVLPFLFGTWILALVTGGPSAPRVRVTAIHVGVGLLVTATCLSIVLNAHELNLALELDQPIKKLVLLCSYALLFLIVASSIRPSEAPAFMKYSLGLALLCALGTVYEYRFHYNIFYDMSHRLLPGFFQVGYIDPNEVDEIGRRMTRGPSEHPLECVGMLSMALPIALVGIINSKTRGRRILYALASALILAAAISTYRKSALLAPLSIILTLAWFRRGDLLKLAPVGAVSLIAIHVLSPGALGSVFVQLQPHRLGVTTVSDRTADYDAIRPDLWSHLLFGRGYGSYDHVSYRVLDSEVLSRLVDTGVLGLAALIFMVVLIVWAARGPIQARHPTIAPTGLAVAAASVAFLVLAFLFDVTSFPHTPYLLMSLAGLLAAQLGAFDPDEPATPAPPDRLGAQPPDEPPLPPAPRIPQQRHEAVGV